MELLVWHCFCQEMLDQVILEVTSSLVLYDLTHLLFEVTQEMSFCSCYNKAGEILKEQHLIHHTQARRLLLQLFLPKVNWKKGHFATFSFKFFPGDNLLSWTLSPQPLLVSRAALLTAQSAAIPSSGSSPGEKPSISTSGEIKIVPVSYSMTQASTGYIKSY